MKDRQEALTHVASWVGRSFADMNCWELVRRAFAARGAELSTDVYDLYSGRQFATVFTPEPWDIVPICNHKLQWINHVGLYLGDGHYIHSLEESGVVITPIDREPFASRIATTRDGRRGFLRLHA